MKEYKLSKEKIAEFETLHRSLRDKSQADRVKTVIALSMGWSVAQVTGVHNQVLTDNFSTACRNTGSTFIYLL